MLIIHTTAKNKKQVKAIVNTLLESHLIACASFCKIQSAYLWSDTKAQPLSIERAKEYQLTLKTLPQHYEKIESIIRAKHSYQTPQIIAFEAKAESHYQQWIEECVLPNAKSTNAKDEKKPNSSF